MRAQCPARPRLPTSQPSHITKTRRRAWRSFLGEHRPAGRPSSRRGEQAGEAALGPHVGPSPCSAGLATGGGCFLRGRRGLLWVKGALAAHRDYRGQGGRDLRRSYLAWATGRSGGKGGLLILVLGQALAKSGPSPEAKSALGSRRISRISRISSRISRTSRISRVIISRGQQVVWVEVVRGDRVSSFALTGAGARSGPRAAPRLRCPRRSSISVPLLDLALLLLAWPH